MDLQNFHFGLDDLQHFRYHHGGVRRDAAGGGKFQRHYFRQHKGQRHRAFHAAIQHDADGRRTPVRVILAVLLYRYHHAHLVRLHLLQGINRFGLKPKALNQYQKKYIEKFERA